MQILDYQVMEKISETSKTVIYRAQKEEKSYILKLIRTDNITEKLDIRRLKQEYEILKSLDARNIIKVISFEYHQNIPFIVMEDIEGNSLNSILKTRKLTIEEFFKIAIQMTDCLHYIHNLNFIHRDFNPNNILLNPETNKVTLIDFELAINQGKGVSSLQQKHLFQGTLDYLSPEQTGRINCLIDNRSDLYSFGITLYEMLSGGLPFPGSDPLEIVYGHLAQKEIPLRDRDNQIPKAVSDIVGMLMEKKPEDRFQSALGIKHDLQICYEMYMNNENMDEFVAGKRDFSSKFNIPSKLYGMESEQQIISDAFMRVSKGCAECLLISGYSGVGKTALVNELYEPITEKNGIFVRGKFDQLQRNIPYHAWTQCLTEFVYILLSEKKSRLEEWKEIILKAVEGSGKLLTDIAPDLEFIIGKQPDLPQYDAKEAQIRFYRVFKNFISAIARLETPLVVFMDDLQWTDMASLNLLKALMSDLNTKYFLWIGAYRDNEVNTQHPLSVFLNTMKEDGVTFSTCKVENIKKAVVNQLISDTVQKTLPQTAPLTALVYAKTQGNAFFLRQFLFELYERNLLKFVFHDNQEKLCGEWEWDLEEINRLNLTDNVVELVSDKMHRLDQSIQDILKITSCIGNSFAIETIALVSNESEEQILSYLKRAESEGFIIERSESYKFSHDRIQQAAYTLVPDQARKEMHLRIGKKLFEGTQKEKLRERIFDIVNQWNLGIALITDEETKNKLSELNYMAGQQAKQSMAYKTAFSYLHTAIQLLGENCWAEKNDFTTLLYASAAEAALFSGDLEDSQKLIDTLLENSRDVLGKNQAYRIKIQLMSYQGKVKESVPIGLEALHLLGIDIPVDPSEEQVWKSYQEVLTIINGKPLNNFLNIPDMTDSLLLAAMSILKVVTTAAYMSGASKLSIILSMKGVALTLQYGHTFESLTSWSGFDSFVINIIGNYKLGHEIYDFVFKLMERFGRFDVRCAVGLHSMITHTKEHIKVAEKGFWEVRTRGLETDDLEYAYQGTTQATVMAFFTGKSLPELHDEMMLSSDLLRKYKHATMLNRQIIPLQAVKNLMASEKMCDFSGPAFDEEKMIPLLVQMGDLAALYMAGTLKMMISYIHEEYEKVIECVAIIEKYHADAMGQIYMILFNFYDSLSRLALCQNRNEHERQDLLERVSMNQEKLKISAYYAPMNYLHKYQLVEAEKNRILGNHSEAMELYDQAIEGAAKNEYIQEEALAKELAAKFYREKGNVFISRAYLKEAYLCYLEWGARSKINEMQKKYPELVQYNQSQTGMLHKNSDIIDSSVMDIDTMIKAAQVISEEIEIERLLGKLMHFLGENAGAQRIYFITKKEGQNIILAEGIFDENKTAEIGEKAFKPDELPEKLINYVENSKESVILSNASKSKKFGNDPYIFENQTKSIMCMPVEIKGRISGLLYLENNLLEGVFNNERVAILKVIASQLAISLENAKLYNNLKLSEEKYRTLIETIHDSVCIIQDETVKFSNEAFSRLTNYSMEEIMGAKFDKFIVPEEQDHVMGNYLKRLRNEDVPEEYETQVLLKNMKKRVAIINVGKIVINERAALLVTLKDITERKIMEEEIRKHRDHLEELVQERTHKLNVEISEREKVQKLLEEMVTHDYLTGLPNRKAFTEILEHAIALAKRNKTMISILFIDLDGFKKINDTLGHDKGDMTLKIVAERLRSAVRASDTVFRLGGDEFTVIMENIKDSTGVSLICQRIIDSLGEVLDLGGNQVNITASIGISTFPSDSDQVDALVKKADDAMYIAKKSGKNRYIFS